MNGQNGFFFGRSPVRTNDVRWRKHGVLHLLLDTGVRIVGAVGVSFKMRKRREIWSEIATRGSEGKYLLVERSAGK